MKPKQSQSEHIIKWLKIRRGKHGRSLTFLSALKMFGCGNMKGRAFDIRKKYPNLVTEFIRTKTGKRIAKYYLA